MDWRGPSATERVDPIDFAPQHSKRKRILPVAGIVIASILFVLAFTLAHNPTLLDLPLTRWMNSFANVDRRLDIAINDLDRYFILSGIVLMAAIVYCWFEEYDGADRTRLLLAALIAFPAGIVSRYLQHALHTHPRPYYDPALHFQMPSNLQSDPLNTWNSFPSDHATVFGALLVAIFMVRPRLGLWLTPYFLLVEAARTYMGAHYPSDLIGGVSLGAIAVCGVHIACPASAARLITTIKTRHRAAFYATAFVLAYLIGTLFADARNMGVGFTLVHAI